jgi:Ribbon-helix-helix protein, copG family
MSHRLQVLIPPELDAQLEKAAQRNRVSKGEWVRRALREAVRSASHVKAGSDPLTKLESLNGPSGGIKKMLSEIESGRS